MFTFLWDCQTVFYNGCSILHSHQYCMRVPTSLHPYQHLIFSLFLITGGMNLEEFYCKEKKRIGVVAREGGWIKLLFVCLFVCFKRDHITVYSYTDGNNLVERRKWMMWERDWTVVGTTALSRSEDRSSEQVEDLALHGNTVYPT